MDQSLPTIKLEFVPTDELMNELPLHEESETVSLATLDPASVETTSQPIVTQELVQTLPDNMKVKAVTMEDSSSPEEDSTMSLVSVFYFHASTSFLVPNELLTGIHQLFIVFFSFSVTNPSVCTSAAKSYHTNGNFVVG